MQRIEEHVGVAEIIGDDEHDVGRARRRRGRSNDSRADKDQRGEKREGSGWLAYEERSFEAWRAYYEHLPRGKHVIEYSLRLNNPGRFALPPTRVEAMYAPEMFGEAPNARVKVEAAK